MPAIAAHGAPPFVAPDTAVSDRNLQEGRRDGRGQPNGGNSFVTSALVGAPPMMSKSPALSRRAAPTIAPIAWR